MFERVSPFATRVMLSLFIPLFFKKDVSLLESFFVDNRFMINIIQVFVLLFSLGKHIYFFELYKLFSLLQIYILQALFIAPDLYFKKLFLSLVCFIIVVRTVFFINGLLLALVYFWFRGAASLSAVLQILRKEPGSRVFCNLLHSLFNNCIS